MTFSSAKIIIAFVSVLYTGCDFDVPTPFLSCIYNSVVHSSVFM
jgi:hypothetical protein